MKSAALDLPPVTWQAFTVGLGVLVAGIVLSMLVRRGVAMLLRWRRRSDSAAQVFGSVTGWAVVVLSVGAFLTVVFPSIEPVNILGGLGVISIAAGIAFQTVLGNMFAGIMLLGRDAYRVGDQIALPDGRGFTRGTVTRITLHATHLRTFDGRAVLVPNSLMHSSVVTVQTGYEQVRSSVELPVDPHADLDAARTLALEVVNGIDVVAVQPAPQAFYLSVAPDSAVLEVRFWSGSLQLDTRTAQDAVIRATMTALRERGMLADAEVNVALRRRRDLDGDDGA